MKVLQGAISVITSHLPLGKAVACGVCVAGFDVKRLRLMPALLSLVHSFMLKYNHLKLQAQGLRLLYCKVLMTICPLLMCQVGRSFVMEMWCGYGEYINVDTYARICHYFI